MLTDGLLTNASQIVDAVCHLREARANLLSRHGVSGFQAMAVDALARLADCWRDPSFEIRRIASEAPGVFPFEMVELSLDGLLESLSSESVEALIASECCVGVVGPPVVGHVIASNTPLLGWTSAIRALLLGSASLIKAPSSRNAIWIDYFVESLRLVAPQLADLVAPLGWKGGTYEIDQALAETVDIVVAYGSDDTIARWSELTADVSGFLGYGQRASAGFVLRDADLHSAAIGGALDVLMYDLGGCLSPQTIFVEGDQERCRRFADALARELDACPLPVVDSHQARSGRVREARSLALFSCDTTMIGESRLTWTVLVRELSDFYCSPAGSTVNVAPFSASTLDCLLKNHDNRWQGASIASANVGEYSQFSSRLYQAGFSYVCKPGHMQKPPISWRENGYDVLASLILR